MKLKIKKLKFSTGIPVCILHEKTAKEIGIYIGSRVLIKTGSGKRLVSIVNTATELLQPGQIAVSEAILKKLKLKYGQLVHVELTERPCSINFIKEKLKGRPLKKEEIFEIINNIANNSLTEAEVAFFISAVYEEGMSLDETKFLIQAMVKSGKKLKLKGKVADKHSIGGVAGNRTTPIIVSICAATGLIMPKTSSRAITSAAGTADTIETIAKVDFSVKEIKNIIKKTNACLVWGGALGLAPVDDKIIRIERIVDVDSPAQLLASILSKKISVGSKYVLIDIPYGRSAKVTKRKAEQLRIKFFHLAKKFDLKLNVVLTDGNEPIGRGIGPALEIKGIIDVLQRNNPPKDLENKSVMLAGKLLELSGKAKKGKGIKMAQKILDSGKALKKFEQIIKAQKGDLKKIPKPRFSHNIIAKKRIKIKHLDNKLINRLARYAGSPEDKTAGLYLHTKKGHITKKGETIISIYSNSKEKLEHAVKFYQKTKKQMIEA